jgi:hypothetical protein
MSMVPEVLQKKAQATNSNERVVIFGFGVGGVLQGGILHLQ